VGGTPYSDSAGGDAATLAKSHAGDFTYALGATSMRPKCGQTTAKPR